MHKVTRIISLEEEFKFRSINMDSVHFYLAPLCVTERALVRIVQALGVLSPIIVFPGVPQLCNGVVAPASSSCFGIYVHDTSHDTLHPCAAPMPV